MSGIKNHRETLLPDALNGGNEKALSEQGQSTLAKKPTTGLKQVTGDYTRFADIAIGCVQFVDKNPVTAHLRVSKTRKCDGLRVAISGRDGRAEAFLTSVEQVDELICRLEILKAMQFGKMGMVG